MALLSEKDRATVTSNMRYRKFLEVRTCGFLRYETGQTCRHGDRNTLHSYRCSKSNIAPAMRYIYEFTIITIVSSSILVVCCTFTFSCSAHQHHVVQFNAVEAAGSFYVDQSFALARGSPARAYGARNPCLSPIAISSAGTGSAYSHDDVIRD